MIQIKLTRKGKAKVNRFKKKYVEPNAKRINKVTSTSRLMVGATICKLGVMIAPKNQTSK